MPQGQFYRYKHISKAAYDLFVIEGDEHDWDEVHFTLSPDSEITNATWTWNHVTFVTGPGSYHIYVKQGLHDYEYKTLSGVPHAEALKIAQNVVHDMIFIGKISKSFTFKLSSAMNDKRREYNDWREGVAAEKRRQESEAASLALRSQMAKDKASGMVWGRKV